MDIAIKRSIIETVDLPGLNLTVESNTEGRPGIVTVGFPVDEGSGRRQTVRLSAEVLERAAKVVEDLRKSSDRPYSSRCADEVCIRHGYHSDYHCGLCANEELAKKAAEDRDRAQAALDAQQPPDPLDLPTVDPHDESAQSLGADTPF